MAFTFRSSMIPRYTRPQMGRIWSEENKLETWLAVEIAACEAWGEQGVIPADALGHIRRARYDVDKWAEYERETHHDFNAFIRSVADSIPPDASRWIHLGLTSYDAEDTALSLRLLQAADLLEQDIADLEAAVAQRALEHKDTLMMGRTHGVHAEPTSFGLKLALWLDELRRDRRRLQQARAEVAYGKISGPVGTHATVPPVVEESVCKRLGLQVAPVSDQVLSRDRHAGFVAALSLVAASLEKFATEIRHLQRTEVLEAEEPFSAGQTGSSAMPHKRNPEKCERIAGLARMFRGFTVTALENVALWHERDISHSSTERMILPDACALLDYMLDLFTQVVRGLNVYPEHMRRNLELSHGLVFSQRVLLALIEKGLKRDVAYKLVQRNAMRSWQEEKPFLDFLLADTEITALLSRDELASLFDYGYYLRYVDDSFRRMGLLQ
ncbi:MAG TPA: adenylosuccinate lyase [Dehalococcoidia bacterium]|nr:adenylosuccinate lyase [Dehalococcoidia bacterium]